MIRIGFGFLIALALGMSAPAAWAGESETLLERLTGGGYVIYWRHAATDRSQGDRDLRDMDRCAGQRNLDARGRAQAQAIGAAFTAFGIPVGDILTSDFCRNRDTAMLAFGRYQRVPDLWNLPSAQAGPMGREDLVRGLRQRLGTLPEDPGKNTLIVGHNLNLQAAAQVVIGEGEMAVFRPLGGSRFELQGTLKPGDFE